VRDRLSKTGGHFLGQGEKLATEFVAGPNPIAEGALRAHRSVASGVVDRAWIEIVGEVAQVSSGMSAEVTLEVGSAAAREVADGVDTMVVELGRGDRTDTPEHLDR